MAGVPGITCAGLPGYGKTSLSLAVLCQLAPHAEHQLVIIDGKGGGDYDDWAARAWLATGDDLHTAKDHLARCFDEMRRRQGSIRGELATTNFWDAAPTPAWPLLFILVDECHTFPDSENVGRGALDAVLGETDNEGDDREEEAAQ